MDKVNIEMDKSRAEKVLIELDDVFKTIIEWIGSESFNSMVDNCNIQLGFKSGAVWGATMATIIINNNAPRSFLSNGTLYMPDIPAEQEPPTPQMDTTTSDMEDVTETLRTEGSPLPI